MNELTLNASQFIIQSPPGDSLAEVLDARGLTQAEFALRTGRPLKTINEIIKGRASITPDTALQFERVLGISAEFWISRDAQYRESQARQAEKQELQKHQDWLNIFPLKEMVELGWINKYDDPLDQLVELLDYFGIAKPEHWFAYWKIAIPQIEQLLSYQHASGSTTAWLCKGEIEFQKLSCDRFQAGTLRSLLTYFQSLVDQPVNIFYRDLIQQLAQAGVAFCVVDSLPGCEIKMVARWLSPVKTSIQVSTSCITKREFWLALYRGLAHILLHGKKDVFVVENHDQRFSQTSKDTEKFAQELLGKISWSNFDTVIPWETLKRVVTTDESWQDFEETPRVSIQTREPKTSAELPRSMEFTGWPGLSSGALQVLMAAGLTNEANIADERLFAEWVKQKLANVESAFMQGYTRDALVDLDELHDAILVGSRRSPVLVSMLSSVDLLKLIIEKQYKPDPTTLLLEIKQLIAQKYQDAHQMLATEERVRYSSATATEKTLADNLFRF